MDILYELFGQFRISNFGHSYFVVCPCGLIRSSNPGTMYVYMRAYSIVRLHSGIAATYTKL